LSEHQLTTLTLIFLVLFLVINEKKRLNTIITPFSTTAFPFVAIAILVNFVMVYFQFKPFTMRAQLCIMLNLIILWLVGFLMYYFYEKKISTSSESHIMESPIAKLAQQEWFVFLLSWTAVIIIFRRVGQLMGRFGGFAFLGDPQFENMMMRGLAAHMGEIAKVCFLLLGIFWSFSKRKLIIFLTMIALFLAIAALQVKYHLLWVLIMLFFYKLIELPVRKQIRAIIFTSIIIILVMNLFWLILTIAWKTFSFSNKGIWQFLFEHTMLYITSAPIAFDQWLNFPDIKPENSFLVVLRNVINVIIGNPDRISALPYVNIGFITTAHNMVSNVGTAYGVYYIIGGWPFMIFMTTFLAWIYYLIFYKNKLKTNVLMSFLNIFCLTMAALTFFDQYFALLSFYEFIILFIIIVSILLFFNRLKTGAVKLVYSRS